MFMDEPEEPQRWEDNDGILCEEQAAPCITPTFMQLLNGIATSCPEILQCRQSVGSPSVHPPWCTSTHVRSGSWLVAVVRHLCCMLTLAATSAKRTGAAGAGSWPPSVRQFI
jgi:hypothetical protein